MRISTTLVTELARTIGSSRPEEGDTEIQIPPVILPTASLPFPLNDPAVPGSAVLQRSSTASWGSLAILNGGGAVSAQLLLLAAGLWRFNVQGCISSNYAQTGQFTAWVSLEYLGSVFYLLGLYAGGAVAAPTAYASSREVEVMVPTQSTIVIAGLNNGAGDLMRAAFHVSAAKLL